jgi:hypothetical protein
MEPSASALIDSSSQQQESTGDEAAALKTAENELLTTRAAAPKSQATLGARRRTHKTSDQCVMMMMDDDDFFAESRLRQRTRKQYASQLEDREAEDEDEEKEDDERRVQRDEEGDAYSESEADARSDEDRDSDYNDDEDAERFEEEGEVNAPQTVQPASTSKAAAGTFDRGAWRRGWSDSRVAAHALSEQEYDDLVSEQPWVHVGNSMYFDTRTLYEQGLIHWFFPSPDALRCSVCDSDGGRGGG